VSAAKRIAVVLEGPGGELDREELTLDAAAYENDPDQAVNDAVGRVIEGWLLSIGDTIRIVEVAS
jgi:hypothetical protein